MGGQTGFGIKDTYFKGPIVYYAEFRNNDCYGFGIGIVDGMVRYVGKIDGDNKEGYGVYYYKDGSIYEGVFKNDIREGYGRMLYPNGKIIEGKFVNDMRSKESIEYNDINIVKQKKKEQKRWDLVNKLKKTKQIPIEISNENNENYIDNMEEEENKEYKPRQGTDSRAESSSGSTVASFCKRC